MDTLIRVGLSNAVLAGLLALLALAAGALSRRPALAHGLWLLVLLKLITPPLVPVVLPLPQPDPAPVVEEGQPITRAPTPLPTDPEAWVIDDALEDSQGEEAEPQGEAEGPAEVVAEGPLPTAPPPGRTRWPWVHVVGSLWPAGAALWFFVAARRLRRFHRLLRHARRAPASLQRRARKLAARIGLKRAPGVFLLPGRWAPMLWAVGRPRVFLPEALPGGLTERGLDSLLLHELAHLKRGDHWVRVVEFVALGLYWWFPLAWLASRQLREAEERCCDAWVVSSAPEVATDYAHALVDTLDFLAEAPSSAPAPALASGLGQVSDLRRRLTMIVSGTTPRTLGWSGRLAVFGLGALLLPLVPLGAQAVGEEDKREIRIRVADEEADKVRSSEDLKRLEEELAKRLAEVQRARARARAEAERAQAAAEKARAEALKRLRETEKGETGEKKEKRVITIVIEVDGDAKDLKEKLEKLDKVLKDLGLSKGEKRVRIGETTIRGVTTPAPRVRVRSPIAPRPPSPPRLRFPGPVPPPPLAAPRSDSRIDKLERQLEEVMRQLDALRRDLGPRSGGKPDPAPESKPRKTR